MKTILIILLCLPLPACSAEDSAPEATPYVRLQETTEMVEREPEAFESYEEMLGTIYVEQGSFYFHDWELEMFKELPQDEDFSFTVHYEPGVYGNDEYVELSNTLNGLSEQIMDIPPESQEYQSMVDEMNRLALEINSLNEALSKDFCIMSAELFAEAGVSAQVRAYHHTEDSFEYTAYACFVTMTPNEMWALSESMEEMFFIEQLYSAVDHRFSQLIWEG